MIVRNRQTSRMIRQRNEAPNDMLRPHLRNARLDEVREEIGQANPGGQQPQNRTRGSKSSQKAETNTEIGLRKGKQKKH